MQAWMPRRDLLLALQTEVRPLPFSPRLRRRGSRAHLLSTHLLSGFGRLRPVPHAVLDPYKAEPSAVGAEPLAWEGVPLRQGVLRLRPRWRATLRQRAAGGPGRAAALVA